MARRSRRSIAVLALCAFLPMTTSGCFGRFELVRKTYKFNRQISSDKWVRWLFFLAFIVFPVYEIAGLIDAILVNSIEFWTGNNLLAGTQRTFHGENGEVAVVTYRADGIMDLQITTADGAERFVRLLRDGDSVLALDENQTVLARVGEVNGRPALLPVESPAGSSMAP